MDISMLQSYWWLIISVLGAILVFLLFIQGGQSLIYTTHIEYRPLIINSLGRKWELTYTTLVLFGGAFFASFPLFYSTSFGGAYWLWMLILLSFVIQAFSYEFRRRKGNIYGTALYDCLLFCNGLFGCVLLGVAVGTFFFGAEFVVDKANLVGFGDPVISRWTGPWHGLEAVFSFGPLVLGFAVFYLARTQACLYFINNISDGQGFDQSMRIKALFNGTVFVVLFLIFLTMLLLQSGYREVNGYMEGVDYVYLDNLMCMWWCIPILIAGVVLVLYGIIRTAFSGGYKKGIWYSGFGTVIVVMVLFWLAGYNATAYYPSITDPQSSLTISNSSSSEFTLSVMAVVSILVPFVVAYIWYVWAKMNATPLTQKELDTDSHTY